MNLAAPVVTLLIGIALFFVPLESMKNVLAIYLMIVGALGILKK
jgi:hypothetical protein|tara:strand:- start:1440 stop:1571 length:132 start_codon:yes stop_codon:yes gene_type:complete